MKVKKIIRQTGLYYPSLEPYYQVIEICSECGKQIRVVEGEVKS